MIRIRLVEQNEKELLWNINQKYLYEMTRFYDDPMDDKGNYYYGYFDEYFIDPNRFAYFIYNDEILIGFAMICPYSYIIGKSVDFVMSEFTIFPQYRGRHFATEAAEMIITNHIGEWEIKYHEKNNAAKKLWDNVTKKYNPKQHHLNDEETVLLFSSSTNSSEYGENNMSLKDKWKETGKNTGKAFGNLGKAIGKTAKVAFTDDPNKVEENGNTELGNAWRDTGKAFGDAGESFGNAAEGTFDKVVGKEEK